MDADQKPWWNDGDKVGGMAATITILLFLAILIAIVVKLIFKMF